MEKLVNSSKLQNSKKNYYFRSISYKYIVFGYDSVQNKEKSCYTEQQVISLLQVIVENIFVTFGGAIFQQNTCVPMGTNCAPLIANLFPYSHELELSHILWKTIRFQRLDPLISQYLNLPILTGGNCILPICVDMFRK